MVIVHLRPQSTVLKFIIFEVTSDIMSEHPINKLTQNKVK